MTPPPIPIKSGSIAASEDGFDVLLTIVLRLSTNEALDMCLRTIAAVARIKGRPGALAAAGEETHDDE